jgi:uncharacterized protein (DUF58 family)
MSESLFDENFLKKVESLYLVSKKIFAGSAQATRRSRKLGAGIDVRDFRQYTSGDDLRHIDWNYFASSSELLLRLFEEEEDLRIYFLVDVSKSMALGDAAKLRHAKLIAGALAYVGLSNLDRVSVVPFADGVLDFLPPSRGRSQIWKVFKFLEKSYSPGPTNFAAAFRSFVGQAPQRGLAVVISDFYDPTGFEDAVSLLRYHRFEPLVIRVTDEDEANFSYKGDLELVDCETGSTVRVTMTPALIAKYQQAHAEMSEELAAFCKSKKLLHFDAPLQTSFDDLVLKVFRAGGFLR